MSRRRFLVRGGVLVGGAAVASMLPDPLVRRLGGRFWLEEALASGASFDPVPDPIAAGWTQVGSGTVTPGALFGLNDSSSAVGAGLEFICSDPRNPDGSTMFGSNDIVLTPRFEFPSSGNVPAPDGNTAVHVTINAGDRMVRAYIKRTATNSLQVVLAMAGGAYSNGFELPGTIADFKLIRRPDGWGRLEVVNPVAGQPPLFEQFHPGELASSARPDTKTLEFGSTPNVEAASNTLWHTLGLPKRPTLVAVVQPPINPDGSSSFNASRGVVPLKFAPTTSGSPTCDLPPATLRLSRSGGVSPGLIDESLYTGPADSGSEFRVADCQYHYNVKASALGAGSYLAEILIGGAVAGSARFELK
jgi:hypothetical protein